jgi:hypothetical protein
VALPAGSNGPGRPARALPAIARFEQLARRAADPQMLEHSNLRLTRATCVGCHRPPLGAGTPGQLLGVARTDSADTVSSTPRGSLARSLIRFSPGQLCRRQDGQGGRRYQSTGKCPLRVDLRAHQGGAAGRKGSGNGFGQPSAVRSCRTWDGRWKEPRRSVCRKSAAAGPRNPKSRCEQPERHSRCIEQAWYSDRTRQGMDPCAGRPCSPASDIARISPPT